MREITQVYELALLTIFKIKYMEENTNVETPLVEFTSPIEETPEVVVTPDITE